MKVYKQIVGKNKLRDLDICLLYIRGKTADEIVEERNLKLTARRVEQIIYDNAAFVNPRVAWPKSKRIMYLQRLAERTKDKISDKRDYLDVAEQLRKEIEGDKPLIDQSNHKHITYVWADGKHESNPDRLQSAVVPDGDPQEQGEKSSGGYRAAWRENGTDDQ